MLLSQSKITDLFAAAYSGNIDLFDLLVQRFNLPPDQWRAVSISYSCRVFRLCNWFPLYLHILCCRISLPVLSHEQLPGDTLQWWSTSFKSTNVTGESWTRCSIRSQCLYSKCAVSCAPNFIGCTYVYRMNGHCCTLLLKVVALNWWTGWLKS